MQIYQGGKALWANATGTHFEQRPYPSPDSVGYQGQWGAYTDVESRAYAQYLRWVFVDGDYYHPLTGSFLTRRSAGTNEYSAGVNPTVNWGRVVGGTLAGIAGGILTAGNPLGVAAGVALFEGLYSAAEGKPASVVVRDAVVSGALAYVGARFLPPAAARVLSRQTTRQAASKSFASLDEALQTVARERFESLPDELYIYVRGDIAQKMMASGKIGRAEGEIVYLTTKGNLSSLQARLELALPLSNTAEVVVPVPKRILDPSRVMLIRPVTGNVYNAPGGGIEILYRGRIDWRW